MDVEIKNHDQIKQGYLYAVRLLAQSKRSEHELLRRLKNKGYLPEATAQIINELKSQGILSDKKLVQDTVDWSIKAKRYGRNRIFFELKKRGIREANIGKALEGYSRAEEQENARSLATERWIKLEKVEVKKRKKRLYDFLISRGFDFELARRLVEEMEHHNDENI